MADAHANFGYSTVAVAPVPAAVGLSLTVAAGQGALFPAVPFNCTVWPAGVNPLSSNAEIIRVTAVVGDVFTIVRAQEGTVARSIVVGDQISNTMTRKTFTDIETIIIQRISAVGGAATASQVEFGNANGISFGVAGQTVTGSHNALTSQSNQAASASNGSFTFQTLNFSNANGLTFGTSAGGIISASHNALTSQSNQAASASNGSFTFQTLNFSNANNVTFGTSAGGIVTASVVAGAAADAIRGIAAGGSTASTSTVNFSNSNGVSFGFLGGANSTVITASHNALTSQSNQAASASNGSFTFQTLNFSNANNVTFGTSAGGIITASVVPGAGGTSWTVSDSATSGTVAQLAFTNLNGVTLSLSSGAAGSHTIVGSHNALTSQSNQAASASNGSFTFQTLNFSNGTNVTFATSAGGIIAASVNAQSTQPVAASASNGSFAFSTVAFSNANNVTFGTSAGSIITASVAATVAQTNQTLSLAATSNTTGNTSGLSVDARSITLRGDGIVSVGFSTSAGGSSMVVSATQSNQAASASNGSFTFQTLNFSNGTNVTFATSAGGIIAASVAAQSVQPVAASASNGSFTFATVAFSNANNVTFGTSAGSIITASVAATVAQTNQTLSWAATSNTTGNTSGMTVDARSLTLRGDGIVSVGFSTSAGGSSVIFSATQSNQAMSAAGGSSAFQTLIFADTNSVSFTNTGGSVGIASVKLQMFAVSNTTQSTSGTANHTALSFAGAGVASVGVTGGTVVVSVPSGGGDAIRGIAAGASTATTSTVNFSNSNGISFGFGGGANSTVITASHNAITSQTNQTMGLYMSSNTALTSSGTVDARSMTFRGAGVVTVGYSAGELVINAPAAGGDGINVVRAGTVGTTGTTYSNTSGTFLFNGSGALTVSQDGSTNLVFSVPDTSSIAGAGGLTVSTNGSTISVSNLPIYQFEPNMPMGTNSTTFAQAIGQWWFVPFNPPAPISGGRLNFLTQFGSTSQLPRGTTSASWGSNTSGQKAMRYQYSLSAALFSLGAAANSTRLESFWSNQYSIEISHNVSISGAAGPNMTVSMGVTLSAPSNIDSAGGITTTTYGTSSTIASASSAISSIANSSILSSVNNMLSDSVILPVPFNTTINCGNYFLGVAWSTASSTTGSSQVGFAAVNAVGIMQQANITAWRMFGRTTTNVSSQVFPGQGAFSASTAAPPTTIAFTDIRTKATNAIHYVNWVNSNAITI